MIPTLRLRSRVDHPHSSWIIGASGSRRVVWTASGSVRLTVTWRLRGQVVVLNLTVGHIVWIACVRIGGTRTGQPQELGRRKV
jgi:hypothetical protein